MKAKSSTAFEQFQGELDILLSARETMKDNANNVS